MSQDDSILNSPRCRPRLLRDQVQLVKRKDYDRYEIMPSPEQLSFEKGFFVVIRACQLLAQKHNGIILVGVAGPSGAGKTIFTEKVVNFMPSVAVLSMNNYNDASRIIDGNFDDPRLTDYDTLLENIKGLKNGSAVQVPIYDFKSSTRIGYRTVEVPSSRVVIIEGIYALSEKLRPLLDLRVSVTGGVHFNLVKRVLRDIQRAGQEPEEIIQQISETAYPMYKAFIEPDLQTAHIKIVNKFNPFSGFQNPTYILKSPRQLTADQIKAAMPEEHKESTEETYDIYLLPPGEDPEACQSYLRMRNREGKYNLMFEEWVTDSPFIVSPRISFEVSVQLLGGLMALGYTIAAILKRSSHVFTDGRVVVKIDWLEQLNRHYIQVQGRDRLYVKTIAEQLGLERSYIPRTYIEQIQLEKLVNDVMALPDDLKTKLSIDDDVSTSPREALSRASADRVALRNKHLKSGISHSYSAQGDKNIVQLSNLADSNRWFISRNSDTTPSINQRLAESPAQSPNTIWLAHQHELSEVKKLIEKLKFEIDDASQKVIEQLKSERDDAKKCSETAQKIIEQLMFERDDAKKCSETAAQKVIEQLMFERDDARKQVEELRRLTKLQNFTIYSNSELQVATNNFHESFKLGEGGFGVVYKGILHNTTIAIKILKEGSRQGEKEFYQEIEILSKVQHRNLVTFIGACPEKRAVIYEYLPNGSLKDCLRCKNDTPPLSWQARTRIAFEIGSALSFLHCSKPHGIVHGDLKPSNILLDLSNASKISDFGLCRELKFTDSANVPFHSTDVLKGTNGYIDPEYYSSAKITPQNDVYSFGIILLELVTCKDIYGIRDLVIDAQQNDTLKTLIDASAGPWPFKQAKKMISLGLRCSDPVRKNRPDLTEVLKEIKSML